MIVRLTSRQWAAVIDHLPNGWLYGWLENEGRIEEVGKKVEVLMLPDAWKAVADELIQTWFTTGSIRKASAPLFDGVRNIVKETNRRQAHPAFAGQTVAGRQFEVLPAWEWRPHDREWEEPPNGRTHWSPWIPSHYEIRDYGLCNLWPEHHRRGGEVVTEWHPSTISEVDARAYERFIKARPAAAGSPK